VVTGKPVLDGEKNAQVTVRIDKVSGKLATAFTPPDYVEERGFGIPHDILFFVDPTDPRGPAPEHPENDPQFARWDASVAEWVKQQGVTISTDQPPTEYDDVHILENIPSVSFVSPRDAQTLTDRQIVVQLDTSARRGVARVRFALDGDAFEERSWPLRSLITIPNRFSRGFHTFTVTALDDVGNSSSTSITINLNADPGPLGVSWETPMSSSSLSELDFPVAIRFSIDDNKSVRRLHVLARGPDGRESEIGTIDDPALPRMSMTWSAVPEAGGEYEVIVRAELKSGEMREEGIPIQILK
jgi:hypothetical protein